MLEGNGGRSITWETSHLWPVNHQRNPRTHIQQDKSQQGSIHQEQTDMLLFWLADSPNLASCKWSRTPSASHLNLFPFNSILSRDLANEEFMSKNWLRVSSGVPLPLPAPAPSPQPILAACGHLAVIPVLDVHQSIVRTTDWGQLEAETAHCLPMSTSSFTPTEPINITVHRRVRVPAPRAVRCGCVCVCVPASPAARCGCVSTC